MARTRAIMLCLVAALLAPAALADPWKDESGDGRGASERDGLYDAGRPLARR